MNITITNSTTLSSRKNQWELWLRLWFEIIAPDVLAFGVISNLIVVIVMPRQNVAIGVSVKIYYTTIAISDFIDLINSWILFGTINDTM